MKKRTALFLAFVMSASIFFGCGVKSEQESETIETRKETDETADDTG